MPAVTVSESLESSKINSTNSPVEEYAKIGTFSKNSDIKSTTVPPITPRTDFAIRQANHLVERICRDHGVEAPKFSFSQCLLGQEDQISNYSISKHTSVLRLAEYLHKRGQIERDYSMALQKLNRGIVQTGDTDERLGQLIVMGEKTAAGHLDWARKIGEMRTVEELKELCGENEEQRKYLLSELKKLRATWSKAVGAFEKVRKNRDKVLKAADSAQLALDTAVSRGNASKSAVSRLQEDAQQKNERARIARDEYNRAMKALTQRQNEIFKEQIPQCMEGFEKMERSRIAAVRSSLINLAQVHLAISDVESESGQRWLKSLVSISLDDEIEMFIESIEERSKKGTIRPLEDEYEIEDEDYEAPAETVKSSEGLKKGGQDENKGFYSSSNLTNSESDLLKISFTESSDPSVLMERRDKLEELQVKLQHQLEALEKMREAYAHQDDSSNQATLEAVRTSIRVISKEITDNSEMLKEIILKLSKIEVSQNEEDEEDNSNNYNNYRADSNLNMINPMESILEELNRLDQRRNPSNAPIKLNLLDEQTKRQHQQQPKKKALSRSFDEIMNSGEDIIEECASPKATDLKLPGAQWTAATISKSNDDIARRLTTGDRDYFCAEEEEGIDEIKTIINQSSQSQDPQNQSPKRKSIGQATSVTSATVVTLIPQNRKELFRVQALYNFIGRKETDELDLRTGEILSVFDANGEWWEAENEAGARGYIPFNYIIRI